MVVCFLLLFFFLFFEEIKSRINFTFTRKKTVMSFYLSIYLSHPLLVFAKSALKIYIRFPFDLFGWKYESNQKTNKQTKESVRTWVTISSCNQNVFWLSLSLSVCFFNSILKGKKEANNEKSEEEKNNPINSKKILEHSGTLCFRLVCGFIWCELLKHQINCISLFYWFQLSGNEIDLNTHIHTNTLDWSWNKIHLMKTDA